jgi:adenylosuccinate lyase
VEEIACQKLGLKPDTASTQVISRDRHADYVQNLALLGATIERFAVEIRNLQKTDVLEVEEFFSKGQKGSSAMPHKRNPFVLSDLLGWRGFCGVMLLLLWKMSPFGTSGISLTVLSNGSSYRTFVS